MLFEKHYITSTRFVKWNAQGTPSVTPIDNIGLVETKGGDYKKTARHWEWPISYTIFKDTFPNISINFVDLPSLTPSLNDAKKGVLAQLEMWGNVKG